MHTFPRWFVLVCYPSIVQRWRLSSKKIKKIREDANRTLIDLNFGYYAVKMTLCFCLNQDLRGLK